MEKARKRAKVGEPMRFIRDVAIPFTGSGCLVWPFSQNGRGYGYVRVGPRRVAASRYVCSLAHGQPPTPSHEAAHECGNRICVNPSHLSWKTIKENSADRLVHGTHDRGERSVNAKLTEAQVREIIRLKGAETQTTIAAQFGVSAGTIHSIHVGKNWSWIQSAEGASV